MPAAAVPTVTARAPGRINLIGEHTDYNGGLVLPLPIPLEARVTLARRDDGTVRVRSSSFPADGPVEYRLGEEQPRGDWSDYVAGVTRSLALAGHSLGGFAARIDSSVTPGAGLSSSAALTVALLRALRDAFGIALDDQALALIAHRAERNFVGAPVGVMDPMVVALGRPGVALFLDTRSLAFEYVPLPASAAIAVIDSGISHRHASGGYRARRAECEEAAARLGVPSLRDATLADVERGQLPPPLDRRARHVVTENARVLEMVAALRGEDLSRGGALLDAAHESLRRDFEVSLPQIDAIAAAARTDPAVCGARLTGGGFGGAVIVLIRRGAGTAPATIAQRCADRAGGRVVIPDVLEVQGPTRVEPGPRHP